MIEWISNILDAGAFMPRGSCGQWSPGWRAAAIAVDLIYGLSYVAIPIALVALWKVKRRVYGRAGYPLLLFAGFILGCGITHFCQVAVWWWPAYRFFVMISLPGAMLSIGCACLLPSIWWHFYHMPTPGQLTLLNEALNLTLEERDRLIAELHVREKAMADQINRLERMRQSGLWTADQKRILSGLAESLKVGA